MFVQDICHLLTGQVCSTPLGQKGGRIRQTEELSLSFKAFAFPYSGMSNPISIVLSARFFSFIDRGADASYDKEKAGIIAGEAKTRGLLSDACSSSGGGGGSNNNSLFYPCLYTYGEQVVHT